MRNQRNVSVVVLLFYAAIGAFGQETNAARTGDWPGWRGADRSNRSSETNLLKTWPAEGPPLLWKAMGLGHGIASVSVAAGRVYTICYMEDREFVVSLNANTGESRWATSVGAAAKEDSLMRWLSQRTPTIDEDRLYSTTVQGELFCLSTSDGQALWHVNYRKDFGSPKPRWGFGDRPLVDGDKLICAPGGTNGPIVALNKRTGAVIWKTQLSTNEGEGYAAPVIFSAGGVRQYVVYLRLAMYGVAADDGRVLWSTTTGVGRLANSYTPNVVGENIFCANGYQGGMALLRIVRDGATFRAETKYHRALQFSPFQDSTVVVGNHVYAYQSVGQPICFDLMTGDTAWGPIGVEKDRAALTYADGHIYARRASGRMVLYRASPDSYTEVSSFKIPEPQEASGATAPVVAGGRLYLRDNRRLLCYDISATNAGNPAQVPRVVDVSLSQGRSATREATEVSPESDAIFVPTPDDVVARMLDIAGVTSRDTVYDLGSGDGRILLAAARSHGSKAVGYEIDRELVDEARKSARKQRLDSLLTIHHTNLFTADLAGADVVALYLPSDILTRLLPQFEKLKPGARIVSHQFRIPGVAPDRSVTMVSSEDGEPHRVYLWKTPLTFGAVAPSSTPPR